MRESFRAKHLRLNRERTPILKEYLRLGQSIAVASTKNASVVLQAWARIHPEDQYQYSNIVNICLCPRRFYSSSNLPSSHQFLNEYFEADTKSILSHLDKNNSKLKHDLKFISSQGKEFNRNRQRVPAKSLGKNGSEPELKSGEKLKNTQGKRRPRSSVTTTDVIRNHPLMNTQQNELKAAFFNNHVVERFKRRALTEQPKSLTRGIYDSGAYYTAEEAHKDPCKFEKIRYQSLFRIDRAKWKNLYISCIKAASDFHFLSKHKITAILSIGTNQPYQYTSIEYLNIDCGVSSGTDIIPCIRLSIKFINEHIHKGNTLICCYSGTNRSCCIMSGYLIKTFRCTLPTVLSLLSQSLSMEIAPHFHAQLAKYQRNEFARSILK